MRKKWYGTVYEYFAHHYRRHADATNMQFGAMSAYHAGRIFVYFRAVARVENVLEAATAPSCWGVVGNCRAEDHSLSS